MYQTAEIAKTTAVPPLQALGLSIGYGKKALASNISLKARTGRFVALIGPNGAGKSTALRTLAGLQPALAGEVLAQGVPIGRLSPNAIAKNIAFVMTERPKIAHLSVYQLVAMGRYPHTNWQASMKPHDQAVIMTALRACKAEHLAERMANSLSDGEFQRCMIARALAQQTPCLLLDEPTAHLDMPSRFAVFELLAQLSHGQSVVMSTHELGLAAKYCHELWVLMPNGSMQQGTPDEALAKGWLYEAFPTLPKNFFQHL